MDSASHTRVVTRTEDLGQINKIEFVLLIGRARNGSADWTQLVRDRSLLKRLIVEVSAVFSSSTDATLPSDCFWNVG